MRELLPEGLLHVLLEVGRLHILYHCGHVGCEDEDMLVLAAGSLRVSQEVGVVLQVIPCIGP